MRMNVNLNAQRFPFSSFIQSNQLKEEKKPQEEWKRMNGFAKKI